MELEEAELEEAELGELEPGELEHNGEQGLEEHEEGQEPEEHKEEQGLEVVPHSPGETLVLKVRGWIPAHAAAFELL